MAEHGQITALIERATQGASDASDDLLTLMYDDLRRQAAKQLGRLPPGQTLQPTALVNEAYLRLVGNTNLQRKGRAYFFAAAARAMRRVLVDHLRRRRAAKRGGHRARIPLSDVEPAAPEEDSSPTDLIELDRALEELARLDAFKVRLVELKFFAGKTMAEIAELEGVSKRTIENQWTLSRALLYTLISRIREQGTSAP